MRSASSSARPTVLLTIPALGPGGAERAISGLAGDLAGRGWMVTLATLEEEGTAPFYDLDPRIALVHLDAPITGNVLDRMRCIAARIVSIRALLKRIGPDVVVSFMDTMNIAVIVARGRLSIPVIVSERIDPVRHLRSLGRLKSTLRTLSYHFADTIVVQTESIRRGFGSLLGRRILVIPNAIRPAAGRATPASPGLDGRFRLIAVGRLDAQKGFDRAIAAFLGLAPRFPEWDLWIWGEGPERARLESMISAPGLSNRVRLPGLTRDVSAELCRAHVMVVPSRYEGFPNILGEGMAAGLPAVGFAGVSGVDELIEDGRTGLLVRDGEETAGLARRLALLMEDPDRRTTMGSRAADRSRHWSPERICDLWADACAKVVSRRGGIRGQRL